MQALIAGAVGGENVTETVEGLARDPVNLCCPLEWRDTPQRLVDLPILTPLGQQITLGRVAAVSISDGPPMIKREDARPAGWVYADVSRRDLASVAKNLRRRVAAEIKRDAGMSVVYSGQFEFLERVNARLMLLVPATLMIIFVWLYLTFGWLDEALLIMATLPFALTVDVWFLNALGYPMSVATGVGFIALAGVAPSAALVNEAIRGGAVPRVRPKAMTVAVILAGLVPVVWASGTGAELRGRIAAPVLGGLLMAPLLLLFIVPAVFALCRWP